MLSRLMTRREQLVLVIFAASILVGAVALLVREETPAVSLPGEMPDAPALESPTPIPESGIAPQPEDPPPAPPEPIGVAVMGAVHRPGLYYLPPDARVSDLLIQAGGTLPEAQVAPIDLTATLIDGTTLSIPGAQASPEASLSPYHHGSGVHLNPAAYLKIRHDYAPQPGTTATEKVVQPAANPERININTASRTELETLPGIGPVIAQRIIDHRINRPFRACDDLLHVHGIGPVRYQALRHLITFQ